ADLALHAFPTRRSSDLGQPGISQTSRRSPARDAGGSANTNAPRAGNRAPKTTCRALVSPTSQSMRRHRRRTQWGDGFISLKSSRSEEHTSELQSRENLV